MQEDRTFPPSPEVVKRAYINAEQYQTMYERSIKDPDEFWLEQADTLGLVQEADRGPQVHLGHRRRARSSTPGSRTASSTSASTASTAI